MTGLSFRIGATRNLMMSVLMSEKIKIEIKLRVIYWQISISLKIIKD